MSMRHVTTPKRFIYASVSVDSTEMGLGVLVSNKFMKCQGNPHSGTCFLVESGIREISLLETGIVMTRGVCAAGLSEPLPH